MAENNCIWVILLVIAVAASGVYVVLKYHEKPESRSTIMFDVVVSPKGDGNFTSISEAVLAAPSYSSARFFIRVASGVYNEVVIVPRNKTNIVLVGDGVDNTKITFNHQSPDFSTWETATFSESFDLFLVMFLHLYAALLFIYWSLQVQFCFSVLICFSLCHKK